MCLFLYKPMCTEYPHFENETQQKHMCKMCKQLRSRASSVQCVLLDRGTQTARKTNTSINARIFCNMYSSCYTY